MIEHGLLETADTHMRDKKPQPRLDANGIEVTLWEPCIKHIGKEILDKFNGTRPGRHDGPDEKSTEGGVRAG